MSGPSQSPYQTRQPQALDLDHQLKQKRVNKTRETYQPRIAQLGPELKQKNEEISALELKLASKYSYHAGLLKKPDNMKHYPFSDSHRREDLRGEIGQKKDLLGKIGKNQKVAEYCRVLEQLVELKKEFLRILENEESELNMACQCLLYVC